MTASTNGCGTEDGAGDAYSAPAPRATAWATARNVRMAMIPSAMFIAFKCARLDSPSV